MGIYKSCLATEVPQSWHVARFGTNKVTSTVEVTFAGKEIRFSLLNPCCHLRHDPTYSKVGWQVCCAAYHSDNSLEISPSAARTLFVIPLLFPPFPSFVVDASHFLRGEKRGGRGHRGGKKNRHSANQCKPKQCSGAETDQRCGGVERRWHGGLLHFVMVRGVCPSFRTACPLSKCIHFYGMGVASFSKTHLIVEGCLDAIATEHSAATKSPSHLWALSLLRIKGRRRALQAASVESKISMSSSVVRRLFFATICVNRIYSCCAHQIDWLRALQSLDRQCVRGRRPSDQTVFLSPALSVLMGMGTPTAARIAHEASRFGAKQ